MKLFELIRAAVWFD